MKTFLRITFLFAIGLANLHAETNRPNFIIIFADDQGYQDLGCFGSPDIKTPNIDQMAKDGMRCTSFYVASAKCSASRASLLAGVYPKQHGIEKVFWPYSTDGMPKVFKTFADMAKKGGYHTACIGKWHLGHREGYMPTDRGFDYYYGIPYSNDMYLTGDLPLSDNLKVTGAMTLEQVKKAHEGMKNGAKKPAGVGKNTVPLVEGREIIEFPCDQATTSRRYAEKTIEFIEKNKNENFLVYMTPAMPHVPLFASKEFKGKSAGGSYGDTIEELDHAVGKVLTYLDEAGLSQNTFVLFSSDNGPWLTKKDAGGHAAPLRDGKMSSFEGGIRVPCVMKMPSLIKPGSVYNDILCSIDLFPTIASLAGLPLPEGQRFDGKDISGILTDPSKPTPHSEFLVYSSKSGLDGIRQGDWKVVIDGLATIGGKKGKKGKKGQNGDSNADGPYLFNLKDDIGETTNLADKHPEKLKSLLELAKKLDAEIPSSAE